MKFQSSVHYLSNNNRKRKLNHDNFFDIFVSDSITSAIVPVDISLNRVYGHEYAGITDDSDPSDECYGESMISSSNNTAVDITDTVKLQLLDAEDSRELGGFKLTEICHLKSQSRFTKDKANINNRVYASRFLHEAFDGINTVDAIPYFTSSIKMFLL